MSNQGQGIDKRQAADILGVSPSSIGHWIKSGYLQGTGQVPQRIEPASVEHLKRLLADGTVPKLRGRANKSQASSFFVPYAVADEHNKLMKLIEHILERRIPQEAALYALVLNCVQNYEYKGSDNAGILVTVWEALLSRDLRAVSDGVAQLRKKKGLDFGEALAVQLCEYRIYLEESAGWPEDWGEQGVWRDLLFWDLPKIPDVLGVVYQVLTRQNVKVRRGAYFTPHHVVEDVAKDNESLGKNVFDPCCGTGNFLLAFAAQGAEPGHLWGMDVDPVAVYLARINLLLYFQRPFLPKIYCGNSLRIDEWNESLRAMIGYFDLVATNPPWGAYVERFDLMAWRSELAGCGRERLFGHESFSLFLALGLRCLRPGGHLSYLLPEAFLMIKRHEEIRRYLMENCSLKNIYCLGHVFHKVSSGVIRLEAIKNHSGKESSSLTLRKRSSFYIDQKRFAGNEDAVFDVWTLPEDKRILDKIQEQPCLTLAGNAKWVMGIVTGDNKRFLHKKGEKEAEGVLRGGDVSAFALHEPSQYLAFQPDRLQQVAQESLYRSPKLVYRFIASRPVAAYDALGRLTLNSANSVIVDREFFPVRAVEALFNTQLYAYIFYHRFHALKVLRAHLERLPLPCWSEIRLSMLAEMAERLAGLDKTDTKRTRLMDELEHEVMQGFALTSQEQARITRLLPRRKT